MFDTDNYCIDVPSVKSVGNIDHIIFGMVGAITYNGREHDIAALTDYVFTIKGLISIDFSSSERHDDLSIDGATEYT
jgi:hypothetical protein